MNDYLVLFASLLAGILLGAIFFGGLWWTVRKGLISNHPVRWFLGSTLLRMSIALTGFYFISQGDWRKLLACLLGFFIARVMVTRFTRTTTEGSDAP